MALGGLGLPKCHKKLHRGRGIFHCRIMARPFPLPFKSLRTIGGGGDQPFIVGAMFTPAYADKALRLAASCENFSLAYELHEVPTVHSSISARGSADPSFTKANFIHHLLKKHRKPVLYVDSDCEFLARPDLILEWARTKCDFAIYNWLADEYTDIFKPVAAEAAGAAAGNRFYRFSGSGTDWYSTTQLVCSGLVQFYGNSLAARALLSRWHHTISAFPGAADDHCLDFTFNNLEKRSWLYWLLKPRWLPKAYARIAFWIYAKPVINHADIPGGAGKSFARINDPAGRQRRYETGLRKKMGIGPIPRDCIVDTETGMLCKDVDGQVIPFEQSEQKFWL